MKKIILIAGLLIFITGCSKNSDTVVNPFNKTSAEVLGKIQMTMDVNPSVTRGVIVDSIFVRIQGATPCSSALQISTNSIASGTFSKLLPGTYYLSIFAFGEISNLVAVGNCTTIVKAGEISQANVRMIIQYGAIQLTTTWVIEETPSIKPIASYTFNGDAKDVSGNGHDGLVTGATLISDRFGKTNSAYYFDGTDDEIRIKNVFSSQTDNNTPLTIIAWVKTNTNKNAGGIVTFHGACDGSNDHNFFLVLYGSYSSVGATLQANFYNSARLNVPSKPIVDNNWHQLALTYTGNESKLYIDGTLTDSTTVTYKSALESDKDLVFGAFHSNYCGFDNHRYQGAIDDVQIFDSALDASEIKKLSLSR